MSILIVGEAVIDIIKCTDGSSEEHPGGSPANVAIGVSRLGLPSHLLTMIGKDARGNTVRQWLVADDVATTVVETERTATAVATLDEHGASTYTFDMTWDLHGYEPDLQDVDHIHTGSIAAFINPGAQDVARIVSSAREHATISYDPNIRPALIDDMATVREQVLSLIAQADVVKCSDEDLGYMFEREALSQTDAIELARTWIEQGRTSGHGPLLVAVTAGKDGVIAVNAAGEHVHVPADPQVKVVDTVGAGDSFMGALVYQLANCGLTGNRNKIAELDRETMREIAVFAARVADITVSRAGANPPRFEEL
ncbi:carbohydrate kinase family protein [Arcanobacterium buesumense]|uniref:Carbohydrate kinase n=1 Tax=Arcanobacterium buesumense TaxID=2722751 RepID=A0A6H2EHP9_9ACTO|nr:carbohydrate kinase [Arcanobacterium buesumense]QJC21088.1 carbohydrate kinase [Arcanobacterium buesumense]